MPPTDEPEKTDDADETGETDDDPTAIAEDGMAPLINNTGVDGGDGDDADASSG